jgi:hypothetical protein
MNVELKVPTALCCILKLKIGKLLNFNAARYCTYAKHVRRRRPVTHFVREYHYLALACTIITRYRYIKSNLQPFNMLVITTLNQTVGNRHRSYIFAYINV